MAAENQAEYRQVRKDVLVFEYVKKLEAEGMGADAIVNVRYSSAAIMQGAAEVMAYGTAVKILKKKSE